MTTQTALLSLNRSSLHYRPAAPVPVEVVLKHRIDELYTDQPFYGSRRMTARLAREGHTINRKRVQQYRREMGIGPEASPHRQPLKASRYHNASRRSR